MTTTLALDLGKKRVGVAVSHGVMAEGLKPLNFNEQNSERFFDELKKIIEAQKVEKLVVGLPLNKDGGETEQSFWTRELAGQIARETGLEVIFAEESFSSTSAKDDLDKLPKKIREKQSLDSEAARIILEQELKSFES